MKSFVLLLLSFMLLVSCSRQDEFCFVDGAGKKVNPSDIGVEQKYVDSLYHFHLKKYDEKGMSEKERFARAHLAAWPELIRHKDVMAKMMEYFRVNGQMITGVVPKE